MCDTPREVLIWQIVEEKLPDSIGITAEEYGHAGWQYQYGMYVGDVNLRLARRCYEIAASLGNYKSLLSLAEICLQEMDMEGYYKWILEAAITGEVPKAYLKLGELYFTGEYVRQEYSKAFRYFQQASEGNVDEVYYYLGQYEERGILKEKDLEKAIQYYRLGAERYDERCFSRLKEFKVDF